MSHRILFIVGFSFSIGCFSKPAKELPPSAENKPEKQQSSPSENPLAALPGTPIKNAEFAGDCNRGECWGDPAKMLPTDDGTCFLYPDIAVFSPKQDTSADLQIWKQSNPKSCPPQDNTAKPLILSGAWQGRVGDALIIHHEMGSDFTEVLLYSLQTGKQTMLLDVVRGSMTSMDSNGVIYAQISWGGFNCVPTQSDYASCAAAEWEKLQQQKPKLQGKKLPVCKYDSSSEIPVEHFGWIIASSAKIDLKNPSPVIELVEEPSCFSML